MVVVVGVRGVEDGQISVVPIEVRWLLSASVTEVLCNTRPPGESVQVKQQDAHECLSLRQRVTAQHGYRYIL